MRQRLSRAFFLLISLGLTLPAFPHAHAKARVDKKAEKRSKNKAPKIAKGLGPIVPSRAPLSARDEAVLKQTVRLAQEDQLRSSQLLEAAIRREPDSPKFTYFARVVVGGGPAGLTYANNSSGKTLIIDSKKGIGGMWHGLPDGFGLNSSFEANDLPGSVLQIDELEHRTYPRPTKVAQTLKLSAQFSKDTSFLLGHELVNIEKMKSGPMAYKITTDKGAVVYTDVVVYGPGRGPDQFPGFGDDQEETWRNEFEKSQETYRRDPNGPIARIEVVRNLLARLGDESLSDEQKVDLLMPLSGRTIALVGAGDGAFIALEGLLGIGPEHERLSPLLKKRGFKLKIRWYGQNAKTGSEFGARFERDPEDERTEDEREPFRAIRAKRYEAIAQYDWSGKKTGCEIIAMGSRPRANGLKTLQGGKKFEIYQDRYARGGPPQIDKDPKKSDYILLALGFQDQDRQSTWGFNQASQLLHQITGGFRNGGEEHPVEVTIDSPIKQAGDNTRRIFGDHFPDSSEIPDRIHAYAAMQYFSSGGEPENIFGIGMGFTRIARLPYESRRTELKASITRNADSLAIYQPKIAALAQMHSKSIPARKLPPVDLSDRESDQSLKFSKGMPVEKILPIDEASAPLPLDPKVLSLSLRMRLIQLLRDFWAPEQASGEVNLSVTPVPEGLRIVASGVDSASADRLTAAVGRDRELVDLLRTAQSGPTGEIQLSARYQDGALLRSSITETIR